MATSTFDKQIYIDDQAADVLISLLEKPAPPRPQPSGIRWMTEEDMECFRRNYSVRSSEQKTNKPQ